MRRCLPALLLALILPLCACAAPDRTATEVTVLKIGKADAILIALPDAAVLVDAKSPVTEAFSLVERLCSQRFAAELVPVGDTRDAPAPEGFDRVFRVVDGVVKEG